MNEEKRLRGLEERKIRGRRQFVERECPKRSGVRQKEKGRRGQLQKQVTSVNLKRQPLGAREAVEWDKGGSP